MAQGPFIVEKLLPPQKKLPAYLQAAIDQFGSYEAAQAAAKKAREEAIKADPLNAYRMTPEWQEYEREKYGGIVDRIVASARKGGKKPLPGDEAGFFKQFEGKGLAELTLPFVGTAKQIGTMKDALDLADKVASGKATKKERFKLFSFLEETSRDLSVGGYVGSILSELVPFAEEVALSGGVTGVGKALGKKGASKLLGKEVKEKVGRWAGKTLARRMAMRGVKLGGFVAQSIAQAEVAEQMGRPFGGGRMLLSALRRQMPDLEIQPDALGQLELVLDEAPPLDSKRFAGRLDMWIEYMSERSGEAITKAPLVAAFTKWVNANVIARVLKKAGFTKLDSEAMRHLRSFIRDSAQWHGAVGEFLEERLGDVMRASLGGIADMEEAGRWDQVAISLDQALGEIIAFSIPGATEMAAGGIARAPKTISNLLSGTGGEQEAEAQAAHVVKPPPKRKVKKAASKREDQRTQYLDRVALNAVAQRIGKGTVIHPVEPPSEDHAKVLEGFEDLGLRVVWFSAQGPEGAPRVLGANFARDVPELKGTIYLNSELKPGAARASIKAQLYHEMVHEMAARDSDAFRSLIEHVAALDPKEFAKRVRSYAVSYARLTGAALPSDLVLEEGVAVTAEETAAVLEWLRAPGNEERLAKFFSQEQPSLIVRLIRAIRDAIRQVFGMKVPKQAEVTLDEIEKEIRRGFGPVPGGRLREQDLRVAKRLSRAISDILGAVEEQAAPATEAETEAEAAEQGVEPGAAEEAGAGVVGAEEVPEPEEPPEEPPRAERPARKPKRPSAGPSEAQAPPQGQPEAPEAKPAEEAPEETPEPETPELSDEELDRLIDQAIAEETGVSPAGERGGEGEAPEEPSAAPEEAAAEEPEPEAEAEAEAQPEAAPAEEPEPAAAPEAEAEPEAAPAAEPEVGEEPEPAQDKEAEWHRFLQDPERFETAVARIVSDVVEQDLPIALPRNLDYFRSVTGVPGLTEKQAEELLEAAAVIDMGVVASLEKRGTLATGPRFFHRIYKRARLLSEKLPRKRVRTSASAIAQAYSTSLPIVALAYRAINYTFTDRVLDPTAGTGMLLSPAIGLSSRGENYGIELGKDRTLLLKAVANWFATNGEDKTLNVIGNTDALEAEFDEPFDVLLANPPYGTVRDENGNKKTFTVDLGAKGPFTTQSVDLAIAAKYLNKLPANGRAVLLLAGPNPRLIQRAEELHHYRTRARKLFFKDLYKVWNVVSHVTISGRLYAEQGASWPVDMVVIHGRGESQLELPFEKAPRLIELVPDLEQVAEEARKKLEAPKDQTFPPPPPLNQSTDDEAIDNAIDNAIEEVIQEEIEEDQSPESKPDTWKEEKPEPQAETKPEPQEPPEEELSEEDRLADDVLGMLSVENRPAFDGEKYARLWPTFVQWARAAGITTKERINEILKVVVQGLVKAARRAGLSPELAAQKVETAKIYIKQFIRDVLNDRIQISRKGSVNQALYRPASRMRALGTHVPASLATPIAVQLERLAEDVGDVDKFVAEELGKSLKTIEKEGMFFAEQMDALALAIRNAKRGEAFILGDQTGVGKGRVVAGFMEWAKKNGKVPVFVTQSPKLYVDMMRDLAGIGLGYWTPLLTNKNLRGEQALQYGSAEKPRFLSSLKMKDYRNVFKTIIRTGQLPPGYDALFTTYAQLQVVTGAKSGPRDLRHHAVDALMPNAALILDEAHVAGGQAEDPRGRGKGGANEDAMSEFVRMLASKAAHVLYSSATYAKNPHVMTLYERTALGRIARGRNLVDLFVEGGVPLAQMAATMLAESGQFIRREQSYDGIDIIQDEVEVEPKAIDTISDALRTIYAVDMVLRDVRRTLSGSGIILTDDEGEVAVDPAVGDIGETTDFASVMHNLMAVGVLSLKARTVADRVIADMRKAREKGEPIRPVIAVDYTGGAILQHFMESAGLDVGDEVGEFTLMTAFERYLHRTREVPVKDQRGKTVTRVYLTDSMLERLGYRHAIEKFNDTLKKLRGMDLSELPGSPIDAMLSRLREAGINAEEITGRQVRIRYDKGKNSGVIERRNADEAEKVRITREFNNGDIDALIANRSASTGISLHAGSKFKNRFQRVMYVVQAASNINDFMQMLGRINRADQMKLPRYVILTANIPAEERFKALLSGKLALLNANVIAARGGDVSVDISDPFNTIGDSVALDLLRANMGEARDMALTKYLGSAKTEPNPRNLAKRMFTRINLLPLAKQREILSAFLTTYEDELKTREALGADITEASVIDLDAKLVSEEEVEQATGPYPMDGPVIEGIWDIKRVNRPLSVSQMEEKIAQQEAGDAEQLKEDIFAAIPGREEEIRKSIAKVEDDIAKLKAEMAEIQEQLAAAELSGDKDKAYSLRTKAHSVNLQIERLGVRRVDMQQELKSLPDRAKSLAYQVAGLKKGTRIAGTAEGERGRVLYFGISAGVRRSKEGSALASSSYTLGVYTSLSPRKMNIPLSRIGSTFKVVTDVKKSEVEAGIEEAHKNAREHRSMVYGNLIRAYSKVGSKGRPIFFLDERKKRRAAIMLRERQRYGKASENAPINFTSDQLVAAIRAFQEAHPNNADKWKSARTEEDLPKLLDFKVFAYEGLDGFYIISANRGGNVHKIKGIDEIAPPGFYRRHGERFWKMGPLDEKTFTKVARFIEEKTNSTWRVIDPSGAVKKAIGPGLLSVERNTEGEEEDAFDVYRIPTETFFQAARRQFQDEFYRLRVVQEAVVAHPDAVMDDGTDAYTQVALFPGRAGERQRKFRDRELRRLARAMVKHKVTPEELGLYLQVVDAPARNRVIASRNEDMPDGGSGWTTQDAIAKRKEMEADEHGPALKQLAQMVYLIRDKTLGMMIESELLSKETAEDWVKTFGPTWVPHRNDRVEFPPSRSRGFSVVGSESKRAEGRRSRASNPLYHIFALREAAIIRGEQNRVVNTLYDLVTENPDPTTWQITWGVRPRPDYRKLRISKRAVREQTVGGKKDGKQYFITFRDPLIPRAIRRLGGNVSPITRAVSRVTRFLAAANTVYDATFWYRNLQRDLQTALIAVGGDESMPAKATRVVKNFPKAFSAIYRVERSLHKGENSPLGTWTRLYEEFLDEGAKVSFVRMEQFSKKVENFQKMLQDLDPENPRTLYRALRGLGRVMEQVNTAAENAIRLSLYAELRRLGLSKKKAAYAAREVTVNFNRHGEWGVAMNAWYLFFNAGVQGTVRTLHLLTTSPGVRKMAIGIAATALLVDLINRAIATGDGDDDKYNAYDDEISDFEKERNWILMLPKDWSGPGFLVSRTPSGQMYLKVPLPWGFGIFHSLGQSIGSTLPPRVGGGGRSVARGASKVFSALWSSFNPMGGPTPASLEGVSQIVAPTLLDPFVQHVTNTKWHGGPLMPDKFRGEALKDHERYWQSTNPLTIAFTKWLWEKTGGRTMKPTAIDVSPETLEHFGAFLGGGALRTFDRTVKTLIDVAHGRKPALRDVPFLRVNLGDTWKHAPREAFYDVYSLINAVEDQIQDNFEDGYQAEARVLAHKYRHLLSLSATANRVRSRARKLSSKALQARKDGREEEARMLEEQAANTYRRFLRLARR